MLTNLFGWGAPATAPAPAQPPTPKLPVQLGPKTISFTDIDDHEVNNENNVYQIHAIGSLVLRQVGSEAAGHSNPFVTSKKGEVRAEDCILRSVRARGRIDLNKTTGGSWSAEAVSSETSSVTATECRLRTIVAKQEVVLKNTFITSDIKSEQSFVKIFNDDKFDDEERPSASIHAYSDIHLTNVKLGHSVIKSEVGEVVANAVTGYSEVKIEASNKIDIKGSKVSKVICENGPVFAERSEIKEIKSNGNCELTNITDNINAVAFHGILKITSDGTNKVQFGYLSASNGIYLTNVVSKPVAQFHGEKPSEYSAICTRGPIIAKNSVLKNIQCAGNLNLTDTKTGSLEISVSTNGIIELNNSEINGSITVTKVNLAAENAFILIRKKLKVKLENKAENKPEVIKTKLPIVEEEAEEELEEELNREAAKYPEGTQGLIDGRPYQVINKKFTLVGNLPKDAVRLIIKGTGAVNGDIIFHNCRGIVELNNLVTGAVIQTLAPSIAVPASMHTMHQTTFVQITK